MGSGPIGPVSGADPNYAGQSSGQYIGLKGESVETRPVPHIQYPAPGMDVCAEEGKPWGPLDRIESEIKRLDYLSTDAAKALGIASYRVDRLRARKLALIDLADKARAIGGEFAAHIAVLLEPPL